MPIDKERELRRYRRLIAAAAVGALVCTVGSFFLLAPHEPTMVAYFGSGATALPFIYVIWRLDDRYTDLLFRDDALALGAGGATAAPLNSSSHISYPVAEDEVWLSMVKATAT